MDQKKLLIEMAKALEVILIYNVSKSNFRDEISENLQKAITDYEFSE